MIEKFRFSVFIGASLKHVTYRVVKRDELFAIQVRKPGKNYTWVDVDKYTIFTSIADLFRSALFKRIFIQEEVEAV